MIVVNLFGAFAIHSPESCPMNNVKAKKVFLEIKDKLEQNKSEYGVKKIEAFYMSVLEHEWMIIFEAESAHDIEFMYWGRTRSVQYPKNCRSKTI